MGKTSIYIPDELVDKIDQIVSNGHKYANRSHFFIVAVEKEINSGEEGGK
ncbi:MAG: ribbon-helix-helix domain-containing protein [Sphaerochaeta sp.]|nr:ribbon-helix-helix domain-containing protein [Sphaerochaeta sp.]